MRIGLFTDTYFPQVSGVATSIRTLKTQLEKMGHTVFIFTTTDRDVDRYEDWQIVRIPSVPFFAFKDRRVAYRGFSKALEIAKQYKLDIIHTQTEFSLGLLGIAIARELRIPVVHTYHTQYEDYVRYIAKGMVIRPSMVKYIVRGFMSDLDGVICPSEIVYDLLLKYKVAAEKRVIPTGIELEKFQRPEITEDDVADLRSKLGIASDETMLLSLSRVSYEKNIQAVLAALPSVLEEDDKVRLVVAGDGYSGGVCAFVFFYPKHAIAAVGFSGAVCVYGAGGCRAAGHRLCNRGAAAFCVWKQEGGKICRRQKALTKERARRTKAGLAFRVRKQRVRWRFCWR